MKLDKTGLHTKTPNSLNHDTLERKQASRNDTAKQTKGDHGENDDDSDWYKMDSVCDRVMFGSDWDAEGCSDTSPL